MAIICNGDTDYVTRTTNLPANNSYTIAGWFKRSSDRDNYERALNYHMIVAPDPWINTLTFYPSWDGGTPNVDNNLVLRSDTGGGSVGWTTLPGTGAWYYLAMTADASNIKGYWYTWNGSAATLVDSTVQSIGIGTQHTATSIDIMSDSNETGKYVDGKCCYLRVWDVALSQSEIEAEIPSSVIVKTANINTALGACTSSSFANDVSGNGRNWTLGAGLTTSDFDSDIPSGLTSGGNPTPGAGSLTLTGASGSMDTRITPRMARNWVHGLGGILVPE